MNSMVADGDEGVMSAASAPLATPEDLLRRTLADVRDQLVLHRNIRDDANTAIRALVDQEIILARAVAVFDRAAAKASS